MTNRQILSLIKQLKELGAKTVDVSEKGAISVSFGTEEVPQVSVDPQFWDSFIEEQKRGLND